MTQNAKHTTGPWVTDGGTHVQSLYTPADGGLPFYHTIARVDQPLVPPDMAAANAHLIAAAPDLLAALRWLIDDLTDAGEDRNPETGEAYDSVTNAREVIAKARDANPELAA